uniref:RING-type domain-containing protein n=1 Tax=Poecilia mexicana TaxID=48701 RepID=A0A3B3XCT3_9TELE
MAFKMTVSSAKKLTKMAEKIALRALLESYLSCHVCSETFIDPVSLSCNHSFCSSCLKEFWEQTGKKNCPICKRSSKEEPQKSGSSERETGAKQLMVCSKHQELPKLFCKDEQRAVCPVCEFSLHQSHKVVPIEEAVSELKESESSWTMTAALCPSTTLKIRPTSTLTETLSLRNSSLISVLEKLLAQKRQRSKLCETEKLV